MLTVEYHKVVFVVQAQIQRRVEMSEIDLARVKYVVVYRRAVERLLSLARNTEIAMSRFNEAFKHMNGLVMLGCDFI